MSLAAKIALATLVVIGLLALGYCIYRVFTHGARSRFLSDIRAKQNGLLLIAIVMVVNTVKWLRGAPFWENLRDGLPAIIGIVSCTVLIWLFGYLFGRARARRSDTIIRP